MDIELARTFLEIVETGNFIGASKRLNVTQSTISMRIKSLEETLGRPLFIRGRSGVTLTAAGLQFRRYALTIVRSWRQARQEIALPPEFRAVLNVGGQFSLWHRLMLSWSGWMREQAPDIALRVETGPAEWLMQRLAEGTLDLALTYAPQSRPGVEIEQLVEETLVLVATDPAHTGVGSDTYLFVDWGEEFETGHGIAYPDFEMHAIAFSHGTTALDYLLEYGGAGYFPARVVQPYLRNHTLHRLGGALEFSRPAFVVFRSPHDDIQGIALDGLRQFSREDPLN
jgi:DNA-binding transcriptional LysR family regulator